jgi:hypothetical protein
MHDPKTVAHEIRRPWPRRSPRVAHGPTVRWSFGRHHAVPGSPVDQQAKATGRNPFPWWKPSSYSPFWVLAGRSYYWPELITIWHEEPGGHDSGTICKRHRRWQDDEGHWHYKGLHGWKWHVWHWRLQVLPVQHFKRWAWSRCTRCGRKFRYGEAPTSHGWGGTGPRWFRGEKGVYHGDCSSLESYANSRESDGNLILRLVDRVVGFAAVDGTQIQAFLEDNFGRGGDREWLATYTQRRRIEQLLEARSRGERMSPSEGP